MAEIGFYHLTRTSVEQALPALLGRTLESGRRAVLRCGDAQRVKAIDEALWRAADPVWLPHGSAAMGHGPLQPIWLTAGDDVPNGATYLFLVDGVNCPDAAAFERVFDLFDGGDPQDVEAARGRWTRAREAGHTLVYWRQEARGWARGGR